MREIATAYASSYAGVSALLFFFLFFIAVALWIFRPGSKAQYEKNASIPLRDDETSKGH
jgi:cbb3-type cytochrome oxidase subunit 3